MISGSLIRFKESRGRKKIKFNTEKHRRRSNRLRGWDYSSTGVYMVTICVQNRELMFGNIENNKIILNNTGKMVEKIWQEIPDFYPGSSIDAFVVMPNHLHGILKLGVGVGPCAHPNNDSTHQNLGHARGHAPTKKPISISDIVGRFKSLTTTRYIEMVQNRNWQPFEKRLWQRNYFDRIIRTKRELFQLRHYIKTNPQHWSEDENNPANF